MTADPSAPRSRRSVLAAALGGLGALVAARVASPAATRAASGDPIEVDGSFTGTGTTTINSSAVGAPAFYGIGAGQGLRGTSVSGVGVLGTTGNPAGVAPPPEVGVYGYSDATSNSFGVVGEANSGIGVYGSGSDAAMLANGSLTGKGLYAYGKVGVTGDAFTDETGVYGFTGEDDAPDPTPGVAVEARAQSTAQLALNVVGKAKFSRGGRVAISAGASSKKVTMGGVTTASYVLATLQTKRTGVYIASVVPSSGYFTIYLNKAVTSSTAVGYLVVN
jgi:hypothetical protein